jgi:prepilin-type N-terminal cleavage/methylation domain-containing protein
VRPGFTLLELMIVTAILAILAGVVVGPVLKARDRARDAAARVELRHAMRAIDFYEALNARLPETVAELASADFSFGPDIMVCGFTRVTGGGGNAGYVEVQVQHRGSRTLLETQHPAWSGRIEEQDRRCNEGGGQGNGGQGNGGQGNGGQGNGGQGNGGQGNGGQGNGGQGNGGQGNGGQGQGNQGQGQGNR